MTNNTFTCEACGLEHEVFFLADIKGKHKLKYTCEGATVRSTDKGGHIITRKFTETKDYVGPKLDGPFREVWTPKLIKQKQAEGQYQLPLMR